MWQCSTIQFDFNLPERFDIYYIDKEGKKARPYMVHRALMGSFERFIGVLLEHYAGALPVWLSPVQAAVLNIAPEQEQYCKDVVKKLKEAGIRVNFDDRNEKIGHKIRENAMQKIPYLLVVGGKELETGSVAVRARGNKDLGSMPVEKFIELVKNDVKEKK